MPQRRAEWREVFNSRVLSQDSQTQLFRGVRYALYLLPSFLYALPLKDCVEAP